MVGFLLLCPRKEHIFFLELLPVESLSVFVNIPCNNSVTRFVVCYIRVTNFERITKIECFFRIKLLEKLSFFVYKIYYFCLQNKIVYVSVNIKK